MVDDQYRALLTEREREILSGDASDSYRYRVASRVRTKIDTLENDIEVLEEHHPKLLDELRDVVCDQ